MEFWELLLRGPKLSDRKINEEEHMSLLDNDCEARLQNERFWRKEAKTGCFNGGRR